MSFLHSAFSLKKDAAAGRKSISSETTEMCDGGGLVFGGEESAPNFWPVQHPIEPPQGERPVECPMPNSVINELRVSRSFQRKVAEPMSKRRHSVSHDGDHRRSLNLFQDKSNLFRSSNASISNSRLNKPADQFQFQFRRY